MAKKKYAITEENLRNIVEKTIRESIFGLNGNDLQSMGMKNPADDYQINRAEVIERLRQFAGYIKEMKEYIDGVEEDVENNIPETDGLKTTVSMRAMWTDDDTEKEFSDALSNLSQIMWRVESALGDAIDVAEYLK